MTALLGLRTYAEGFVWAALSSLAIGLILYGAWRLWRAYTNPAPEDLAHPDPDEDDGQDYLRYRNGEGR